MDIIGKLITEWSWRCEKGYPDINNPSDMAELEILLEELGINRNFRNISEDEEIDYPDRYEEILGLIEDKKNNVKLMERIYRILYNSDYVKEIKDFLNIRSNIKRNTWDSIDLPEFIISTLQRGERSDDVTTFYKTIVEGSPKIKKSGRVIDEYPSKIQKKITEIGNIPGTAGRVTAGRGEVLLAMTFSDLRLTDPSQTGDLMYNGDKSVEVKATIATETRYPSKRRGARLWKTSSTSMYEPLNSEIKVAGNTATIIRNDFKLSLEKDTNSENDNNVELFISKVEDFLKNAYFDSNDLTLKLQVSDFDSEKSINDFLYKAMILGYQSLKKMDYFLLFNPLTTEYKFYTVEEFIRDLQSGAVKTSNFNKSDTVPQLMEF